MPDPIIVNEGHRFDEIFTGGTLTGIKVTASIRVNSVPIVVQTSWDIPEEEQVLSEQWSATKLTAGPDLVKRAMVGTNLEYKVYQAINSHLASLATE